MDTDENTEQPKFGSSWEQFENVLEKNNVAVSVRAETCAGRSSTASLVSEGDARKSKFLEDLNWFKEASDETNKHITEPGIDNETNGGMYGRESIINQPKTEKTTDKTLLSKTEQVEWERLDDIIQERVKRESKTYSESITKRNTAEWETFEINDMETEGTSSNNSKDILNKTDDEKVTNSEQSSTGIPKIRLQAVSLQGIYNVQKMEDKCLCEISDICQFTDDITIIVDEKNKSIKMLGVNYYVTAYLKLPDAPFGICKVDKKEVAVTLLSKKTVQMISVKKKMTPKKYFNVKDVCRGIIHYEELFYICCGGSLTSDHEGFESQGHIGVYSKTGTFLARYARGISSPMYLCLNHDATKVFITDYYNGLIVLDLDGRLVSHFNLDAFTKPSGVCCLNEGLFCLSHHERNEVLSFDETGMLKIVLLQRKEGLVAPRAVCYDFGRSRLIVSSMWSDDTIKVFNLHLSKQNI